MKCDHIRTRMQGDTPFFPSMLNNGKVEVCLKEDVDAAIAELKDKCQMHDFFWEGCGFARRGFKNTIAVSEAFDRLEAENKQLKADVNNVLMQNQELCRALQAMYSVEEYMKLQNENAELKQKLHDAEMRSDLAEAAETERKIDYKELKERHRWRKVSEEMPEVEEDCGEIFLVVVETKSNTNPKGLYITSAEFCNGEWYNDVTGNEIEENIEREDCFYRSKITHWMPLPEQPKEADK